MTFDPTHHDKNEEREEAEEAKEEADPAVNDPSYMPNIEPQKGPNSNDEE